MKPGRLVFFETGLFVFILLAPLSFGAVYSWAALPLAALLFFLFLFFPDPLEAVSGLPRFFTISTLLIFLALAAQFFLASIHRYVTGIELVKWLACASGFVILQGLEKESVYRLMGILFLLGVAESLYGMIEVISGHEHVLWQAKESCQGFVTGTYFNRNHLAGFLELSMGAGLGLLFGPFCEQKPVRSMMVSLLLIILLAGLLKTGSRIGLTSLLMVLFFFFSIFLLRFRGVLGVAVFLIWAAFLGSAAFYFGREILFSRLVDWEIVRETLQGRLLIWQDALRILRDHSWSGTGLGTYEWISPAYQSAKLVMGGEHASNDYLELAVELGIPLFSLLILNFAGLWLYCMQRLFASFDQDAFPMAWGVLIGISALALHSFMDFNLAIPANHYLFILIFGMAARLLRE